MSLVTWSLRVSLIGWAMGQESWVVLGPGEGSKQEAEVVGLPLGEAACFLPLQPYPESVEGAAGALLPGELVTICGGSVSFNPDSNSCYSLHPFLGTWDKVIKEPMPYGVFGHQALALPGGDLMILGGGGGYDPDGAVLASTIIYSLEEQAWREGPDMPSPLMDFCAVPLNSTHALITCGGNEVEYPSSDTFLFDGASFHRVSGPLEPRSVAGCGLMPDGRVMVAGGLGPGPHGGEQLASVEIYDIATDTWSTGPALPRPLGYPAGLVTDGEKMVLLGGYTYGNGYTTDIHSLAPGATGWMKEDTTLAAPKGYLPAITITAGALDC